VAHAAGISSWASRELQRGAKLQEMFDVQLYRIPWNPVAAGEELPAHEVSQLNRRYTGETKELRDYYEIPDLPHPFDILACQQQNLGWGARVRRRYANAILGGVIVWSMTGLLLSVFAGLTVTDLVLRWYVPSLGILLLGLDESRGQRGIASRRERLLSLVRTQIAQAAETVNKAELESHLIVLARQVQDSIFDTRAREPRVPDWFFVRFRDKDHIDFQAAMKELVSTLDGR
jgi:hypothetical protein